MVVFVAACSSDGGGRGQAGSAGYVGGSGGNAGINGAGRGGAGGVAGLGGAAGNSGRGGTNAAGSVAVGGAASGGMAAAGVSGSFVGCDWPPTANDAGASGADAAGGADAVGGGGAAGAAEAAGGAAEGGDALIVPVGLSVMPLSGGNGVLNLTALTLEEGPSGLQLFAALKNEGATPACDAGLSIQLYDQSQQSVGAGVSGLSTQDFYRINDGSGTRTSCVGPGSVAMAAITDLASDAMVSDIGYVVYSTPYFALDVTPIQGLSVVELAPLTSAAGTSFKGTFRNGLDVAVSDPSVSVFVVNRVGRPLGTATASSSAPVASCGTWTFDTNVVTLRGADAVAFPTASLPQ